MSFSELIQKRYSVRAYKPDPVEEEKLQQVLEAARLAPTAVNRQPFRLLVIRTAKHKEDLKQIYSREWFTDAPVVIAICTVESEGWARRDGKTYVDVDATIALDHLILAATELGLGTCWIGAFDPEAARKVLALPEGVEPLLFTPLGYPADEPRIKKRKDLSDLVQYLD